MIRLRPDLPFWEDETPTSWAARLAALHSGFAPDLFLNDMGLSLKSLVLGDLETVERLAALGGVDPAVLVRNAVRRLPSRCAEARGEVFHEDFALALQTRVCPRCLLADAEAGARDLRTVLRGRFDWQFPAIRVCPSHGVRLIDIRGARPKAVYRPMYRAMSVDAVEHWRVIRRSADAAAETTPSPLQNYVITRLEGRPGPSWLDGQPLDTAVKACELLGAVALRGARPKAATFTEAERDAADAAGFEIAAQGAEGICRFFDGLHATCYTANGRVGPQAIYGYLSDWASRTKPGMRRGPLLELLFEHANANLPLGPGDTLFGRPVEKRYVHSIWTLGRATKLQTKRLRKILEAREVIPRTHRGMADNRVLFEAAAGEAVAADFLGTFPMVDLHEYLGCRRTLARAIVSAGLLEPLVTPDRRFGLGEFRFSEADAKRLLDRLLTSAAEQSEPCAEFVTLALAVRGTRSDGPTILRALLEGRLRQRRRLAGARGLSALLVSRTEVRAMFRDPILGSFYSVGRAARLLQTSSPVVVRLMAPRPGGPLLPSVPAPRLANSAKWGVRREDLEAFMGRYVSLTTLYREYDTCALNMRRRLEAAGVAPAFDKAEVGATFYRRDELPADL